MAVNCDKCGGDLSNSKSIIAKCAECNVQRHGACAGAGSSSKVRNKTWKCEQCLGEPLSGHSDVATDTNKDIAQLLQSMKTEIIGEFRTEIRALKEECMKNNARLDTVEDEQAVLKTKCESLEKSNSELCGIVRDLQQQIRDNDQHSRAANLEIQGVPVTPREDIMVVLGRLAAVLQLPFTPEDISVAHRLRLYSDKLSEPPIIVQFISRTVREKWLIPARKKKGIDTTGLSTALRPGPVYVNDHLTSFNKKLLGRARRLLREKKLSSAGYFNGKVLVKKTPEDAATRVFEMSDLDVYDTKSTLSPTQTTQSLSSTSTVSATN